MAARVEGWLWKYAKRRLRQELEAWEHPNVSAHPFAALVRPGDGPQVFRSLIQVNFHPHPKT